MKSECLLDMNRVALRVRPFLDKEEPKSYLSFIPNQPHIIIDQNRQFTFDHVYSPSVSQEDVYQSAIQPLFDQFITGSVINPIESFADILF